MQSKGNYPDWGNTIAFQFLSQAADPSHLEKRFIQWVVLVGGAIGLLLSIELLDALGVAEGVMDRAEVVVQLVLAVLVAGGTPLLLRGIKQRKLISLKNLEMKSQLELLLNMTSLLHSAEGNSDANSVLRSSASSLMPEFGGALYLFSNSGNQLELSTSWNWPDTHPVRQFISPAECWTLKRGKMHLNLAGSTTLCCAHHQPDLAVMEIPMMAQGRVFGLFLIERSGEDAEQELRAIADVARAVADAMSLALSNFALRERLRTHALRDALTGLYNRRYMDDALKRCIEEVRSSQLPLSVLMIDLDRFKKLNDEHGHALGDAVLADTASTILANIRTCDIACRYGGEEFVVILPDCTLEDAESKAELLRLQIERLSERHGVAVSASLGVSTTPEKSDPDEVLVDADRALYSAKRQGRNRVATATPPSGDDFSAVLRL